MKPRPKLRTFCRWMLTILTVKFVVVWIGSGWYAGGWHISWSRSRDVNRLVLDFNDGVFSTNFQTGIERKRIPITIDSYVSEIRKPRIVFWSWMYENRNGTYFASEVPTWSLALLVAIPAGAMWIMHMRDRRKPGMCKKCGYDITGLVGNEACPECGTKFTVEGAKTIAS